MSEVSANLVKLEYPTLTSVKLDWSINGDTPPSITIKDECSEQSLVTVEGDNGGTFTLTGLPANQQYRLFLQSNYSDGPLNSNLLERYPGKPCAAAKPPVTVFPALEWKGLPKTLNDSNKIVVTCVNENSFIYWLIDVNGDQQPDNLSGSQKFQFPASPQWPFTASGDGYLSGGGSTGWGPAISGKGVANYNSVTDFLNASGVDGTGGLLTFLKSSNSGSVRVMLGI
jgi:hypothetical protein